MSIQYGTILTDLGAKLQKEAVLFGAKIKITKAKIGDGSGAQYQPESNQTGLRNVVYECNVNSISPNEGGETLADLEVVIPYNAGPFWVREIGFYDENNNLIYISAIPEREKTASESLAMDMSFELTVQLSTAESVEFIVDPNRTVATHKFVMEQIAKHEEVTNGVLWSDLFNYDIGDIVKGSDNKNYYCNKANKSISAVDPVGDLTDTWREYPFKKVPTSNCVAYVFYDGLKIQFGKTSNIWRDVSWSGPSIKLKYSDVTHAVEFAGDYRVITGTESGSILDTVDSPSYQIVGVYGALKSKSQCRLIVLNPQGSGGWPGDITASYIAIGY